MLDLELIDNRFLAVKWKHHPADAFVYRGLTFQVVTNANIVRSRVTINSSGIMQLRINPDTMWGIIRYTVDSCYDWCIENHKKIISAFDTVTWRAQKRRTMRTNDVVFIWGMPYLLELRKSEAESEIRIIRPRQVIAGLVPKGRSRFGSKVSALIRNGYISKECLNGMPVLNQGRIIMPRHCLWDDISCFDRKEPLPPGQLRSSVKTNGRPVRLSKSDSDFLKTPMSGENRDSSTERSKVNEYLELPDLCLSGPELAVEQRRNAPGRPEDLNNYYLEQFALLMQQTHENLLRREYFGSRMLSEPRRTLIEGMISEFTDRISIATINKDNLSRTIYHAESRVTPLYRQILEGSINNRGQSYSSDPFMNFDLSEVADHDKKFTFSIYDNFISSEGVNMESPVARMTVDGSLEHHRLLEQASNDRAEGRTSPYLALIPERPSFISMSREQLMAELNSQLEFYRSGDFAAADGSSHLNLTEQELTFFTTDGQEIDPSLALMGYLPDMPFTANCMYDMSDRMAVSHATHNYQSTLAGNILARKVSRSPVEYFHRTLVKPGVLRISIKGEITPDRVQSMIEQYMDQEVFKVGGRILEQLKPQFIATYMAASSYYDLLPINWMKKLYVKAMSALGLCTSSGSLSEITLNRKLCHYPVNVMISVGIHELCHLAASNHGPAFKYMLSLFCPSADNVSDSLISMGIVELSRKKPSAAAKKKKATKSGSTKAASKRKDVKAPKSSSSSATRGTAATRGNAAAGKGTASKDAS